MVVTIERIAAERVRDHLDQVELIYRLAFHEDRTTSARFRNRLISEAATFPGFQFHAAYDGDDLIGFIYGYHLQPTNWWPEMILPSLREAGQEHWLDDCFELVEFAVDPSRQGSGVGGRLYDTLFAEVTEPRAMLGTDPPPTVAHTLYTRRGWITILDDWHITPDDPEAHIVMALDRSQIVDTGADAVR